jgi:hypothetical protein
MYLVLIINGNKNMKEKKNVKKSFFTTLVKEIGKLRGGSF